MDIFWEKFGFVVYYIVITAIFLIYYSSKYNINLSKIGKIIIRFDLTNQGKKFWIIFILSIILFMSVPSFIFQISFEYDWVRLLSQIILVSIILYRYTFVSLYFGSIGFYIFDDLVLWNNIKKYEFYSKKKSLVAEITFKDDKKSTFYFPLYLKDTIETLFNRYVI